MTTRNTSRTKARAVESGAKTPQDFAEAEINREPIAVTVEGIDLIVDPSDISDFRLLRAMKRGDEDALFTLFDRVAGDKDETILEHLEDELGRVPSDEIARFIGKVFQAVGAGNS